MIQRVTAGILSFGSMVGYTYWNHQKLTSEFKEAITIKPFLDVIRR